MPVHRAAVVSIPTAKMRRHQSLQVTSCSRGISAQGCLTSTALQMADDVWWSAVSKIGKWNWPVVSRYLLLIMSIGPTSMYTAHVSTVRPTCHIDLHLAASSASRGSSSTSISITNSSSSSSFSSFCLDALVGDGTAFTFDISASIGDARTKIGARWNLVAAPRRRGGCGRRVGEGDPPLPELRLGFCNRSLRTRTRPIGPLKQARTADRTDKRAVRLTARVRRRQTDGHCFYECEPPFRVRSLAGRRSTGPGGRRAVTADGGVRSNWGAGRKPREENLAPFPLKKGCFGWVFQATFHVCPTP